MHDGLGSSAFARRYWRNHYCFLFLRVLRWFTSPRCLYRPYEFRPEYDGMTRRGFPHSDIPGSKLVCSSPRLFAAYRVLHRLLAPRHSPYALSSLTIGIQELTIAPRPFAIRGPRQSLFPPSLRTLRVFCDYGKNYRLQDIQLRKNTVKFHEPDFCDDQRRRKLCSRCSCAHDRAPHTRKTRQSIPPALACHPQLATTSGGPPSPRLRWASFA